MQAARLAVVGTFALLTGGCVTQPAFGGPLPVRNNHPAQLTILHLPVAGAGVLPAGAVATRASAAYSSLFLNGAGNGNEFYMDGEYLRLRPAVRAGLGADLELELAVPLAYASGGFLDSFLIDYHDAFSFPAGGRGNASNDQFLIEATENGEQVFAVEPHRLELMDVPLVLSWCLDDPADGFGLALRAGCELPTGSAARGYGNGDLDLAIGLAAEQRLGSAAWYAHVQHTFAGPGDAPAGAAFEFADVTALGLGLELPLTERLSAIAQAEFETSTLRRLDLLRAEREQLLLWVGGRYRLGESAALEVAFGEDLQRHISPDFTAWLAFAVGF